jgi:CheY-like chemotaxis protein
MTRSDAKPKRPFPTALLVDDNPDDLLFFQLAWQKAGVRNPIRVAASRKEAVDYLEGHGKFADRSAYPLPSVIILDLRLPDGKGCELVRWIRGHSKLHQLYVVVLSGYAHEEQVREAYRSGANSFLLKASNPFELEKTVGIIQSAWLTQHGQQTRVRV